MYDIPSQYNLSEIFIVSLFKYRLMYRTCKMLVGNILFDLACSDGATFINPCDCLNKRSSILTFVLRKTCCSLNLLRKLFNSNLIDSSLFKIIE